MWATKGSGGWHGSCASEIDFHIECGAGDWCGDRTEGTCWSFLVTQLQYDKLQICQFVDSLVGQYEFVGVIWSAEVLASLLLPERRLKALQ